MTASSAELFEFGGLTINEGPDADFFIESFTFTPAQKKPTLVSNAEADGEALADDPNYGPSTIEWLIRVADQGTTAATLAKAGQLTDAVQACTKIAGGQPIVWTVHDTETPYTAYAITGDITEVPVTPTGDQAGWLIDMPVFKIKLTCSSFWARPPRVVKASTESPAEPLQVLYVKGVLGDARARARLLVTDKAAQDRRFGAWGADLVTSEANPPLLLTAASGLATTGFAGEAKTRAGAFGSEKVIRATAVSQATTMFGTGRITNVGSYAVYYRVWATSASSLFRMSYRSGDGPLQRLEWKPPPIVGGWSEIYMGEAFLDEAQLGTQTSEIRIDQKSLEGTPVNDGNYIILVPTGKASARARGMVSNVATNLIAYDNFEQAEGSLESQNPNFPASGSPWVQTNKTGASGFKVNAAGYLERTAVSDASLNSGCFAQIGTTSYSTFQAAVTILPFSWRVANESLRSGILGRYGGTEKWIIAVMADRGGAAVLRVIKNVSGTVTLLGESERIESAEPLYTNVAITLLVSANGSWSASATGNFFRSLSGHDSDLASGGTLATGKVGIYDAHTGTQAVTRQYDAFQLLGAEEPGRVCYSGRRVEFNSDGCERQDPTGIYDGTPSIYRGGDLWLQPAGELGVINRIAVRLRRNDNDVEEDSVVTDKHAAEVLVEERFLLPR